MKYLMVQFLAPSTFPCSVSVDVFFGRGGREHNLGCHNKALKKMRRFMRRFVPVQEREKKKRRNKRTRIFLLSVVVEKREPWGQAWFSRQIL